MLAAIESVDMAFGVHAYRGYFLKAPPKRQTAPTPGHLIDKAFIA
jgi:hypothetical protein